MEEEGKERENMRRGDKQEWNRDKRMDEEEEMKNRRK
jgi:hypothetical protein